jgi:hypothetical protein
MTTLRWDEIGPVGPPELEAFSLRICAIEGARVTEPARGPSAIQWADLAVQPMIERIVCCVAEERLYRQVGPNQAQSLNSQPAPRSNVATRSNRRQGTN